MIVFGIDPGSHRTGWGAVRIEGTTMCCVDHGVITAPSEAPLSERVEPIYAQLVLALAACRPHHVFLESIFHYRNARSALILGHARGVALLAAQRSGSKVGEVSPAEVKKAVTGSGRAEKAQVQEMVRLLLRMDSKAPTDAADALAIAIAGTTRARSPIAQLIAGRRRA